MREIAQTVDHALLTLQVTGEHGPQTIRGISERLGVSVAAARRIIVTLHREGMLRRREDGRYDMGPKLIRMTEPLLDRYAELAHDSMQKLAFLIGRTVLLSAFRADNVFVLHQVDPHPAGVRIDYLSALSRVLGRESDGLVMLAHLNSARRTRLLAEVPVAGGENELQRIREDGYVIQGNPAWGGPTGASAPVCDAEIGVIGSLTILGESRAAFTEGDLRALRSAAAEVGLGYRASERLPGPDPADGELP